MGDTSRIERTQEKIQRIGNFGSVAAVLREMEALEFVLPEPPSPLGEIRRFSADGAVFVRGTSASVYVGGTLIGEYDEADDDRGPRVTRRA